MRFSGEDAFFLKECNNFVLKGILRLILPCCKDILNKTSANLKNIFVVFATLKKRLRYAQIFIIFSELHLHHTFMAYFEALQTDVKNV